MLPYSRRMEEIEEFAGYSIHPPVAPDGAWAIAENSEWVPILLTDRDAALLFIGMRTAGLPDYAVTWFCETYNQATPTRYVDVTALWAASCSSVVVAPACRRRAEVEDFEGLLLRSSVHAPQVRAVIAEAKRLRLLEEPYQPKRRPGDFLDRFLVDDKARVVLNERLLRDIQEYVETSDDDGVKARETLLHMLSARVVPTTVDPRGSVS